MKNFISVCIESIYEKDDLDFFDPVLVHSDDLIVCTLLWESPPLTSWQHRLEQLILRAKFAGKTIILVMGAWFRKDNETLSACGADEVIFIDFFLTLTYVRLVKNQESVVRTHWNPESAHWLFLTGKATKLNRLPLLYRFYQDQLLTQCRWSLFVTDRIYAQCRKYLTDLNDDEAKLWIEKFSQSPDDITVVDSVRGTHYSGIPYGNIYESCLFQVVPECNIHRSHPFMTEKTWLPIINRTPFLIFGDQGSNLELQRMGFLTFDELLCDDNFDKPLTTNERMDSILRNVRHWLDILPKNAATVSMIVEHNHNRFIELAKKNLETLDQVHKKYSMHKDIYSLIDFKDHIQHAQWKNWYNRIRDPSWPDSDREEDFHLLPDWIQKECIEIFGYQPKEQK